MSLCWLYVITIPLGLGLLGTVWWLSKKPVLNDADKAKVVEFLAVVNELEDRMERFYDQILYREGDRMREFDESLNDDDFRELWGRYSSLRAGVSTISPKLSEQARKLVSLLRHFYGYILKDTPEREKPALESAMRQSMDAIEVYRRAMSKTVESLVS